MKRTPPYILIAPVDNMWEAVKSGQKKITIRSGLRDYQVGDVTMLCCHIRNCAVMADIVGVYHGKLSTVPMEFIRADGFGDHENALQGMQRFYPDMTLESDVTVVLWDNLRGKMVE